jgi:transposase-like protein
MEDQGSGQGPPKRKSARYKRELVLELIRGGTIEQIARREGITAKELEEWREQFIRSGGEGFKSRRQDSRPEEARQVIGDLTMENELLKKKIELKERTRDK